MTSHPPSPTDDQPPRVVVRWVDPALPNIWQIGYEVDGQFRPWAGGSSEEALRQLIAGEQLQAPYTGVRDRRQSPRPGV